MVGCGVVVAYAPRCASLSPNSLACEASHNAGAMMVVVDYSIKIKDSDKLGAKPNLVGERISGDLVYHTTSVLKVHYTEINISSQHQTHPGPKVCLLKQPGIEARDRKSVV